MTPEDALAALRALGDPQRAEGMAAYHKVARVYLGVRVPEITALAREWRRALTLEERLELAAALWESDIHEACLAAAKLLDEKRIRPSDAGAWALICRWAETFDGWALADHACMAGQKRLVAAPERIETVAQWTEHPNMWTRRAALVITLPWTRLPDPDAADTAIRERVLSWAVLYLRDEAWFIQKAVAWWLRDLSRRDPERVRAFLDANGARLKPFARREAAKYLA